MRKFFPSVLAVAAAMAGLFAAMLAPVIGTSPAAAQFVCDSTTPGGADGATATGAGSVACGTNATAVGEDTTAIGANAGVGADPFNLNNTAVGSSAGQSVDGGANSAFGKSAGSNVTGGFNSAFGNFAGRDVAGSFNSAFGNGAGEFVTGDGNSVFGSNSGTSVTGSNNSAFGREAGFNVTGSGNSAFGDGAGRFVQGSGNVAIGRDAGSGTFGSPLVASNTVAIGTNAVARADGAVAIGNGAEATRPNQVVLGTADYTYSTPGITSAASKAAQSAPTHIVTSNAGGDLAAYTPAELGLATASDLSGLQSQINGLRRRDQELAEGIAISLALAQPMLRGHQTFGFNVGWGNFDGSNALGVTAAGVVSQNALGPGSSVTLYGGVGAGTDNGMVAGRAGVSFGW